MTEREDFERDLLELAPELLGEHRDLLDEWTPDQPPPTVWTAMMGAELGRRISEIPDERLQRIFSHIESAMTQGSQRLQEAVATGLLEALANQVSGGQLSAARLASLVGPDSGEYLKAWDEFTMGEALADYGASQEQGK